MSLRKLVALLGIDIEAESGGLLIQVQGLWCSTSPGARGELLRGLSS
jgi:hypothetical protein